MKKEINVAAVFMKDGKKVFLAQRPMDKHCGGQWEFFGGKLEIGETHEEAAVREAKEELNLDLRQEDLKYFDEIRFEYEPFILNMKLFEAVKWSGELKKLDVADFAWVGIDDFDKIKIIDADVELVEKVKNYISNIC